MSSWENGDGLHIKFGPEQGDSVNTGTYTGAQGEFVTEVDVNLADLDGDAVNIVSYNPKVKEGALLKSATLVVSTAATGGTSIDMGLYNAEGTSAIDADGFIDGVLTAAMTVGATIAGTGALINTKMSAPGVFSVTTVGTFTAGRVKLKLVFEVVD